MRSVIVICTMILAHCIAPDIMTAHIEDMPFVVAFSTSLALLIGGGLDILDLFNSLSK